MTSGLLDEVLGRVAGLEADARDILSGHEAAGERIVTLEPSYEKLDELSIAQDELFRESLRAVENGLFRAAHVLAWAGFIDYLHNYLWDHFESQLSSVRPKWKLSGAEDFREHPDFGVIEAGRAVGAYNKTIMKALHGLLNTRNETAHPSDFFPDLNDALGYLSGVFKRVEYLQSKT